MPPNRITFEKCVDQTGRKSEKQKLIFVQLCQRFKSLLTIINNSQKFNDNNHNHQSQRYLPVQVNEEKYEEIAQMDHTVAHMLFNHSAVMNLGRIKQTHVSYKKLKWISLCLALKFFCVVFFSARFVALREPKFAAMN